MLSGERHFARGPDTARIRTVNVRLRLAALMTILGVVAASAVSRPAQAETPQSDLTVIDKGGLFAVDGIRQAEGKFAASQTNTGSRDRLVQSRINSRRKICHTSNLAVELPNDLFSRSDSSNSVHTHRPLRK
jgi:hypothetical protein